MCRCFWMLEFRFAPYRFSLPPHPTGIPNHYPTATEALLKPPTKPPVTTISHYHFDHHTPSFEDWVVNWTEDGETARQIYQNKTVLAKNPKENINASQRATRLDVPKNRRQTRQNRLKRQTAKPSLMARLG